MATFEHAIVPGEDKGAKITALAATTASAIQTLGTNVKFAINADDDIYIRFGLAAVTTPDSSCFRIPAGNIARFDLGSSYDSFKVFNAGAGTVNIWYIRLSQF